MKKMLYAVAFGIFELSDGMQKDSNSYHFSSQPVICATGGIDLSEKEILKNQLADCSKKFQESDAAHLKELAEQLIPTLQKIFLGGDSNVEDLQRCELSFYNKEYDILTASANLVKACHGLPIAAYKLALMYEEIGLDNVALLWVKTSYNLGIIQAKELEQRLLIKVNYRQC